ncbi:FmdB family zinc ribbon protein [Maridesulfovibrio frigidus]|uniref:FmdB family zinc ribbon protein n=1 Tax=Maridesulfovibrio frigidus TaxID=340956 RepID=UPI0004E1A5FD|nr:zinc ribbon domain-containing protein [Maridesulfovibrio frigidus]
MPIYEYKCNECGLAFEELVSASSTEAPMCTACKSPNTVKLISACCKQSASSTSGGESYAPPAGGCGSSGFS